MSTSTLMALNVILALMMYGIALSLKVRDFKSVLQQPKGPLVGLGAQFLLLPGFTCLLTSVVPMPPDIALGLILVSCCPGGSFSNIVTHLARGNTAMSVSMTGVASLLAAFLTPFNFVLYSSLNPVTHNLMQSINVPGQRIFTIVALVLGLPLLLGLITGRIAPGFARRAEPYFRFISLFTLFGFIAIALYSNWARFAQGANIFLLAVVVHNAMALTIGWLSASAMKLPRADVRAITLEVGLQNSGLGLGIIFTFFSSLTGMAVIAAGWGIWHLVSGLGLCFIWHKQDQRRQRRSAFQPRTEAINEA